MANSLHSSFQGKDPAQITKAIGDPSNQREGLYVPFEYAAWMDAQTGEWQRFRCETKTKGDKCTVQYSSPGINVPKRIVTDGLTTCVSINIISRKGTIMTHIPPYMCRSIMGESRKEDEFEPNRQHNENIVHVIKQLKKKNHLKDMSAAAVVTISGPEVVKQLIERQEEVQKVVKKLFGLQVNKWEHLPKNMSYKFEGGKFYYG